MSFLKSDLTYSLGGGFLIGALALFFMQPVEQRVEFEQSIASTVSSAKHIVS